MASFTVSAYIIALVTFRSTELVFSRQRFSAGLHTGPVNSVKSLAQIRGQLIVVGQSLYLCTVGGDLSNSVWCDPFARNQRYLEHERQRKTLL
jgi:hypothetical protein